ncbi:MAG: pantetheine-phosphate adenylyltransferase [Spirochaetia bacterium]
MIKAVFPGSFDPPTYGHLNIIDRASKLFDEIHVVIAVNANKNYLFSGKERSGMMEEMVVGYKNVFIHTWDRLIVDFAEKIGARVLLRGVRALSDFAYEFELSMMNKGLDENIDTLLIPTDPQYFVLRSSAIKELAMYDGDISKMVPKAVESALKKRLTEDR